MARKYTQAELDGFRRVHQALTSKAPDGNVEALAQLLGPDGFDMEVSLECTRQGVDFDTFDAWAMDPDAHTEVLDAMGYFNDTPQA